jgi:hypothetical protein
MQSVHGNKLEVRGTDMSVFYLTGILHNRCGVLYGLLQLDLPRLKNIKVTAVRTSGSRYQDSN